MSFDTYLTSEKYETKQYVPVFDFLLYKKVTK